ncbi:MAG TPA: VWA domain-containing protein [Acidobacteriaceae bacterium]|nr:VWA domain-containing protein [Acidobacteriaceae bacterium]
MNLRWTKISCALALQLSFFAAQMPVSLQAQSPQQAPAAVPDAPAPQAPAPMSDVKDQITPGSGSTVPQPAQAPTAPASSSAQPDSDTPQSRPAPPLPPDTVQGEAPATGGTKELTTFVSNTNAVEVPVTVKDKKGNQVAGLTFRDFRVFENNQPQRIAFFSADPRPLAIAFVIDQSVTQDVMSKVNNSLGSLQGALTPYDEVSVISYNNGAKELSGWTGAQSHRLEAVLALNKATGREEGVPVNSGPLAGCPISANGACVDPNIQEGRSAGGVSFMNIPKEIHTLNDAILLAAQDLSRRPNEFRRMIYVVSDGKEYGSKATRKEVIHVLQANKIALYATLVGDSARWGEGYLSRFHIPFQMNDDVLPKYTQATGGDLYAENSTNGIEKSYQKVAEEARTQYTIVYYSHEAFVDGKYRSIDVRVDRPSKEVEITAKPGYYPTALDANR